MAQQTVQVIIYTKKICPYCDRAKELFQRKGVTYEEIGIDNRPEDYAALKERTGLMTVPQIFINSELIGGYTDLAALDHAGLLDAKLK